MRGRRLLPWLTTVMVAVALAVVAGGYARTETPRTTIHVGFVTDTAGLNDRSFNDLGNRGLQRAKRVLKVKGRVLISRTATDYIPNLSFFGQQHYKVTVANGFLLADAVNTVSQQFPQTYYAIIDYAWKDLKDKPKNAIGITFRSEQSGFLVGYLAALVVKKQGGPQVMGSVGGKKIPSVDSWIAGYQAGAKKANPNVTLLNDYSGDFPPSVAPKCKELALNQIAQGAQVIFQVAGGCGLGTLDATKEQGKWGIGVDQDQAFLGNHILTSGVKRVDNAVFLVYKAAKEGKIKGGKDTVWTLKNKGMGVGKIPCLGKKLKGCPAAVPKAFVAKMNAQKALIIKGKIKIPSTL